MLKRSKLAVALTAALLCAMPVAVSAAEETPVVITTDKSEYEDGEKITETIVVTNTTGEEASNITVKGAVPKGYKVEKTGATSEWAIQYEKLAPGQSTQYELTLVKAAGSTGDTTHVLLWGAVAVAGVAGFVLLSKKKNLKSAVSALMVVLMVASLVPANAQRVDAAEKTEVPAVTKEITVGGQKIKVSVATVFNDERLMTLGANMLKNPSGSEFGGFEDSSSVRDGHTAAVKNGAIEYVITDVGKNDYDIQLKHIGLSLEKGATYKVSFNATSSEARTIKPNVMHDGTSDQNWDWYGGATVALEKGKTQKVEFTFTAEKAEASGGLFVSLGQMFDEVYDETGKLVSSTKMDTPASTITLSDFTFAKATPVAYTEVVAPTIKNETTTETPTTGNEPTTGDTSKNEPTTEVNLLNDANWAEPVICEGGAATITHKNETLVCDITNVGTKDYSVQVKQLKVSFEKDTQYKITFDAVSTKDTVIKAGAQSDDEKYTWYGSNDAIELVAGKSKTVEVTIDMTTNNSKNISDPAGMIYVAMGKVTDKSVPAQITLSNFKMVKVSSSTPDAGTPDAGTPDAGTPDAGTPDAGTPDAGTPDAGTPGGETTDGNLLNNADFSKSSVGDDGKTYYDDWTTDVAEDQGASATITASNGTIVYDIANTGSANWNVQLKQEGLTIEDGKTYTFSCNIKSTEKRTINVMSMDAATNSKWFGGLGADGPAVLEAGVDTPVTFTVSANGNGTQTDAYIQFALGKNDAEADSVASTIYISNVSLVEVTE